MDPDLRWLLGVLVSSLISLLAILVGAFKTLASRIAKTNERIDQSARRDDVGRLDTAINELRNKIDTNHAQIIDLLTRKN